MVDLAIWAMSSVDVFVQRIAEGLHTVSSSLNIFFLRPMFSNTASTICAAKAAAAAAAREGRARAGRGGVCVVRSDTRKKKNDGDDSSRVVAPQRNTTRVIYTQGHPLSERGAQAFLPTRSLRAEKKRRQSIVNQGMKILPLFYCGSTFILRMPPPMRHQFKSMPCHVLSCVLRLDPTVPSQVKLEGVGVSCLVFGARDVM